MPKFFSRLPKVPKRQFVPSRLDCSDLKQLVELHKKLLNRQLPDVASVKQWLDDVQELTVVLGEHDSLVYIRKTINTRDQKAKTDYLHLIQKIHPGLASYSDQLNQKLLQHPTRSKFPQRWARMLKYRQNAVDLFKEKNVSIESRIEKTALQYSQLTGGLEVTFEGKKQTLTQMGVYLENADRPLRQKAWETVARRRYQEKSKIESIYDQLVKLRTQVARNPGFKNFRDFCHQKYDRFDYTPKECFAFHDSVEEVVMPALRKLRQRRREEMGLAALKPWDLAVDPLGRPPLKPFGDGKELAHLAGRAFDRVDVQLGKQFHSLIRYGVLDLENRSGKEPGGYQCTLAERKLPFIFMNAVGRDTDVRTLLHEGGHAFHMLAAKDDPILDYRHAPTEFCEVASMGMELLANRHMKIFYPKSANLERSTRVQLEGTLEVLPWVATIDAFQQWIYTHPEHSRAERCATWMKLRKRYSEGVDWSGYKHFEEVLWHRQLHLFGCPFYYIEYGIAQVGALMVWERSLKNPAAALNSYKRALALGGSTGLRELFSAAGGRFDFRAATMKPVVRAVMDRLGM